MKKIALIIGVVGLLGLMACAKKATTETTKAAEVSTEIKSGDEGKKKDTESKDGTEKASEVENEAKGKESGKKEKKDLTVINGTITDAAMFSVSIQGNDGKDYELTKTEKSDLSGLSQGIEIGTKVEVTFDKDMNIISMVDPGK